MAEAAELDPDCPFARARREALELELGPGQALFIPALWAHNVLALPDLGPGVAVNVFWKHLADACCAANLPAQQTLTTKHMEKWSRKCCVCAANGTVP